MNIRFCLLLGNRSHIGLKEFKAIGWLPVNIRFEQIINSHVFKQQNNMSPKYMNELFTSADQHQVKTRVSADKLLHPHCNGNSRYKSISFLRPKF